MDNPVGSRQFDIIIGMLLGDGFLERNGKHCRLVADHSAKQTAYVKWKARELTDFNPKVISKSRNDSRTNQIYNCCILRTKTSPKLEIFYDLFYKDGKKKIPKQLPKLISPLVLAIWIMDDGYRRNDCRALRLNTQSYDWSEQKIIQLALARLKISSTIHKQKKYYLVYIPSRSMPRLQLIMRPLIIPTMAYKIV